MFGKKKLEENRFIIAVKDYPTTTQLIKEGNISLPFDVAIYQKLLESESSKVDNLKELKKFIKVNRKIVKEVKHFWEGLIVQGYTLINVEYADRTPALTHLCSKDIIKYVSSVD